LRNLAASVFQHGQITTTMPKAKAVQPLVEKLITLARRGDLHSRRLALSALNDRQLIKVVKGGREAEQVEDKTLIQKLFDDIAPRYKDRPGGYSRIIRLGKHRIGDGSDLVVLQLVNDEVDSGPEVKGRYSRRRQMQDNRTVFAAKLRKGKKDEAPVAEAQVEAPAVEAPAEEAEKSE
jgi:large subunit ribosomal protein L17